MASESKSKLRKGVGKRIIETLKEQELEVSLDEVTENTEGEQEVVSVEEEQDLFEEENETLEEEQEETEEEISYSSFSENDNYLSNDEEEKTVGSDIDTLLNLISQLPSGVTKQTGAVIIRQTMEAMGISMNKVLGNAQSVQESLETNIRNNVNVIEEYRTKIKILEQEIQKFKKKSHELEDVISLFILSDEKKK